MRIQSLIAYKPLFILFYLDSCLLTKCIVSIYLKRL